MTVVTGFVTLLTPMIISNEAALISAFISVIVVTTPTATATATAAAAAATKRQQNSNKTATATACNNVVVTTPATAFCL